MNQSKAVRYLLFAPMVMLMVFAHFACKTNPTNPSFKDVFGASPTPTPTLSGGGGGTVTPTPTSGNHVFVKQWGSSGNAVGQFYSPHGIAVDDTLNVYVSDYINNRVQVFNSSGNPITQWTCAYPQGIAVNNTGDVYVAEDVTNTLQHFSVSTGASNISMEACKGGDFVVKSPVGMAVDDAGAIYTTSFFSDVTHGIYYNVFWKYTMGYVCLEWYEGSANDLTNQQGCALNSTGNYAYVTDAGYHCVRRITLANSPATLTIGTQGTGDGQFNFPHGIAVSRTGHVYVVDSTNNRIQEFDEDLNYLNQWGAEGSANGQFENPWGVAVDKNGYIYVTDAGNNRIQKFAP